MPGGCIINPFLKTSPMALMPPPSSPPTSCHVVCREQGCLLQRASPLVSDARLPLGGLGSRQAVTSKNMLAWGGRQRVCSLFSAFSSDRLWITATARGSCTGT